MTPEQMIEYAKSVVAGGPVKKADVLAFMKAIVEQTEAPAEDPDLQAGGPPMTSTEIDAHIPALPFEVERTESGIHMPREANRAYTRLEAAALMKAIADALR